MGAKALNILNIKPDNLGRILVIEVKIDDSAFVLINIYNTKPEQLNTFNDLINILETFEDIYNKSVVLVGDFNVILNFKFVILNNRKSRLLWYSENS